MTLIGRHLLVSGISQLYLIHNVDAEYKCYNLSWGRQLHGKSLHKLPLRFLRRGTRLSFSSPYPPFALTNVIELV